MSIQLRVVALACLAPLAACGPAMEIEPLPPAAVTTAPTPTPTAAPAPTTALARTPPRADPTRIPRDVLFGNPDRASPQLSPDGKQIGFLAPVDGVQNVWVGPIDDPGKAKPVTADKKRGIRRFLWAYTNRHVVYLQDQAGDENWRVYAVDLEKSAITDLTPIAGVNARIQELSPKKPDEIVVGLNDRDAKHHDLWRVNLRTTKKELVHKNEAGFADFVVDEELALRAAVAPTKDGGFEIRELAGKEWKPFVGVGLEDALGTKHIAFDDAGKTLYMFDSRGRDTAALLQVDWKTKKPTVLAENTKADFTAVLTNPKDGRVQATASTWDRRKWTVLDKAVEADLDQLAKVARGDLEIVSRSLDDKRWIAAFLTDDGPVRYYRWDRAPPKKAGDPAGKATFLFTSLASLEKLELAKMHPVVFRSRDGLDLVSYLTLPRSADRGGKPDRSLPMVLVVHGGPWARDSWGYNPTHQWLADRGYAVLSVNYRGSTGFGKRFVNAGNLEWARKMHDDLVDGVEWAVTQKVAERPRVAIFGGSYGGYSTLVGLTFTPQTFACGVDIVGPSNLVTLLSTIPPYWAPLLETMTKRVGDHRTDDGKKLLLERSPLTHVERIQRPLLIGQGANDPRVKQAESDQIVKAMRERKIPVVYVVYPDEGHGFARPPNRTSFNAVAETFLAQCLGGPYEPVGDDFNGSSIEVRVGAEEIQGIAEALKSKK